MDCFNIEVIVIIEGVFDVFFYYVVIKDILWVKWVIIIFRFDDVVDVLCEDIVLNIEKFGEFIGEDIVIW